MRNWSRIKDSATQTRIKIQSFKDTQLIMDLNYSTSSTCTLWLARAWKKKKNVASHISFSDCWHHVPTSTFYSEQRFGFELDLLDLQYLISSLSRHWLSMNSKREVMNVNQAFSSSLNSLFQRGSVCFKSYITESQSSRRWGTSEMHIKTAPSFHLVRDAGQI